MIGLGKWGCDVNSLFYSGKVEINITDNNGMYHFDLSLTDFDVPEYRVLDVQEEGSDTLKIKVLVPMIAKEVEMTVTFTENSFSGIAKVPFLGKVKFKDGYKIA
ncbi:MAG TPA: hypothetical protein DDY98_07155 [Ruminococcaceae bacterium]|nr:hypothetical protein [Oscillospiraceae bacterium]